jgi:uncharacterized protein DUF4382
MRRCVRIPVLAAVIVLLAVLTACDSGGGSSAPTRTSVSPAMVSVTVSDPATCSSAAGGPYSNFWLTITDVQVNTNAAAGDSDSSWVDLTPNLKNAPQQVDLLAAASSQCFLATLASNTALQPGSYPLIRVILADNSAIPANNHCGAAGANCVVLASSAAPHPLLLASESKTGIKIPSGQIAGGSFTVASGETKNLNIDFDCCDSIVVLSGGLFRLKTALHAGEVATTSPSITGTLVDKATNTAIAGGKAIVALEQKDSSGVDRVIMETTPDSTSGAFSFCPVPAGTYDVVAVAVNGSNVAYAATITTGVQPGNALGNVPMIAVAGTNKAPGTITGQVTAVISGNVGNPADIMLSALQIVGSGDFTIPAGTQSATLSLSTPASYTMTLPPVNPTVGAFAASGTTYTAGNGNNAIYTVEGQAFVPMSGGTADCTPSKLNTVPVTVSAGGTIAAPTLAFSGCQ